MSPPEQASVEQSPEALPSRKPYQKPDPVPARIDRPEDVDSAMTLQRPGNPPGVSQQGTAVAAADLDDCQPPKRWQAGIPPDRQLAEHEPGYVTA